jgi:hypothetical protein
MRFHTRTQSPLRDHEHQALLATPLSFKARQMTGLPDRTFSPLPEELDRALRGATDRTLVALTALRRAVRQHVQDERNRGIALDEIEIELRTIITRVLKDAAGRDSIDGERDTLANQMIKWSAGFYHQKD